MASQWPLLLVAIALVLGCGPAAPTPADRSLPSLDTCEAAYRAWIENAAALNSPDVEIIDQLVRGESVQRRVFELCRLEEAERYNRELPIEIAPGIKEPMIEPDFRTFAEVECVDEGPLLAGTALCAEVGK